MSHLPNFTARLVATSAALLIALTGCGGHGDGAGDGKAARPDEASTCAEYLKMSDADKQAAYKGATAASPVYLPDGAHEGDPVESYDLICGQPGMADEDPFNAYITNFSGSCDVFTELPSDVQEDWAAMARADADDPENAPKTVGGFELGCLGFGGSGAILAGVANVVSDCAGYTAWQTESRLGYKTGVGICAHAPLTGTDIRHPGREEIAPGQGCDYDPETDAVVPLSVYAVDWTGGEFTRSNVFAAYTLEVTGTPSSTTASVEPHYSDVPKCREPGERNGIKWSVDDGSSRSRHYGFVVLHDWISPATPDGATADLGDWALTSAPSQPDDGDEIVASSEASLSLAAETSSERGSGSGNAGAAGLGVEVTKDVIWSDGYTGTAHYFVRDVTFATNIDKSPPNMARLEISFVAGGEYTDTTTTRNNGPSSYGSFGAAALYEMDSPACALVHHPGTSDSEPALDTVTFSSGEKYCMINIAERTNVRNEGTELGVQRKIVTYDIDEGTLNVALESLESPAALVANQAIAMLEEESACRYDLDGGINAIGAWLLETAVPGIPCEPSATVEVR